MAKNHLSVISLTILSMAMSSMVIADSAKMSGHWVSAWSAAVQEPIVSPSQSSSLVFDNQTIRMIVRPTIGGARVRIRLSNAFGSAATAIGAVHVALVAQGAKIVPESDHGLTFGG